MNRRFSFAALAAALVLATAALTNGENAAAISHPASLRYASDDGAQVPDFQRHILPLMGRLGCNSRSCHGSFQGRGGFRLSLFGYDFKADYDALFAKKSGRVDRENPEMSKILQKPTLSIPHKGGKRLSEGTWAYHMILRWIDSGAKGAEHPSRFEHLEVTPAEIVFQRQGQTVPLKVVAHWADGSSEDVTCLSRFRTNDEAVADIDENGVVTSKGKGDTHVVAFYDNGVAVAQTILPVSDKVGPNYPNVPQPTKIDELVVAKLKKLGVIPSEVCTDGEFLRRVSLDLTGTPPTPDDIEAFRADTSASAGKRAAKVDELLSRPAYSAWWATKLCDITGDSQRNLIGQPNVYGKYARHWYEWLELRVRENMPYDQIIAGIVLATSRKPGQSYDDYIKQQAAYYRDEAPADFRSRETMPYFWMKRTARNPEDQALAFSHTFLGVRLECAQCHKHPFDQWTQDDFKQFAAFFTRVRFGVAPDGQKTAAAMREKLNKKTNADLNRELLALAKKGSPIPWQEVFVAGGNRSARPSDKAKGKGDVQGNKQAKNAANRVVTPKLLGDKEVELSGNVDPRKPLMDWMRSSDNPYFARAFVNRVWANYFGRGIVNPPDDMNLANPPVNAALLDYLTRGFIDHKFDMKWLHREIILSQTYQRSWHANETNQLDEKNFSRAVLRRLPAEVLLDALVLATAGSPELAKADTPAGLEDRAIGPKAGGSVGRRNGGDYAARLFGRSPRDTNCDCAASNEPNLLQSIYLQNDQETLSAIDRRGGWIDERTGSPLNAAANQARATTEKAVAALQAKIADLQRRSEALHKAGDDQASTEVKRQLEKHRADLAAQKTKLNRLPNGEPRLPFVAEDVIRDAFLRTLGRRPTDAEAARARAHLASASNQNTAVRDLMWALLNTKEFATNH